MKKISSIRNRLQEIPDVFYPVEPELAERGKTGGIQTFWSDTDSEAIRPLSSMDPNPTSAETKESNLTEFEEMFEFAPEIENEWADGVLGGEKGAEIKRASQILGVDAFAWYVSFHAIGAQWGIYISTTGIRYMFNHVLHNIDVPFNTKLRLAIRAIHQHEIFHFACDYMAGQFELLTGEPIWVPSRQLKTKEWGSESPYIEEEEALANANMIRSFRGKRGIGKTSAIKHFVQDMGRGYRNGVRYVTNDLFTEYTSSLGRMYLGTIDPIHDGVMLKWHISDPLDMPEFEADRLFPEFPIDWRYCPVHFVHDQDLYELPPIALDFLCNLPEILETNRFTKKLRGLPARIAEKWNTIKRNLATSVAGAGYDFKRFSGKQHSNGNVYSLRLSRNHRVHLLHSKTESKWFAIDVGTHTEMGHD